MSTFTWNPRYGASVENTPRVRRAQFGDGYQQRVGDGINTLKRKWSVSFKLDLAEMDAIDAFLKATEGELSFDWTPPNGPAGTFIVLTWNRSSDDGYDTITATFEETFE